MPYSSIDALPPAVKQKIKSEKKRRQWMHVWNSEYASHGDESRAFASAWAAVKKGFGSMTDFNLFLPISKVDRTRRTVSGYATTPDLDLDGEIVSLDAVKKALPGYWEWRNVREMHQPKAVGVGQETHIDEHGLWLTAKIVDEDAWQKCVEGVYKGFSIGGKKLAKVGNTITELDWIETSIVDRPANPKCKIEIAKRAKGAKVAYLLKTRAVPGRKSQALSKMAEVVDLLVKSDGPPAAHDGFSLPVKKDDREDGDECDAHGIKNCPECLDKRDFSAEERRRAAASGAAEPGGSFPILNAKDLDNAMRLRGHGDKAKNEAHIRSRAQALGLPNPFKNEKKMAKKARKAKKLAKKTAKTVAATAQIANLLTLNSSPISIQKATDKGVPDFLTLNNGEQDMTKTVSTLKNDNTPDMDAVIEELAKRFTAPSKAKRMEMAKTAMRKARKARKDAMDEVKECHAALSKSYTLKLAKAGGKKKPENDNDDDDMAVAEKVLKGLQKAYSSLTTVKTFMKSAEENLTKAAGRSGQRGEEAGDGEAGVYEVPPGVKDLSSRDLSTAGPGAGEHGSMPVLYGSEHPYPGKVAKNGMVPQEYVEMAIKNAELTARLDVMDRVLPNQRQRPYGVDMSKMMGGGQGPSEREKSAALFEGVKPGDLGSEDSNTHLNATAKVIGNMLLSGKFGKSVMDPAFRGGAGAKTSA